MQQSENKPNGDKKERRVGMIPACAIADADGEAIIGFIVQLNDQQILACNASTNHKIVANTQRAIDYLYDNLKSKKIVQFGEEAKKEEGENGGTEE